MNDPENFLSRWSRRKRDAGEQREKAERHETSARSTGDAEPSSASAPSAPPAAEFDVSSLPPIESIDSKADISAFLQKGVPETLRHAALRRAWSADPTIRDFIGLNENYWDGVGQDGVPGFGELDRNLDVKRLVAELFGETPRTEPVQTGSTGKGPSDALIPPEGNPETDAAPSIEPRPQTAEAGPSRADGNVAAQKPSDGSLPVGQLARRHGGAMPE